MYQQFNIQQFYVLPTQTVFMCFVWIWEQTAIISLYNINWLVCITETECVYCAVRTVSVYTIQFNVDIDKVPVPICSSIGYKATDARAMKEPFLVYSIS